MSFHMNYIAGISPKVHIVVGTNDTDVWIILAYHIRQKEHKPKVWLDVGLSSNNTRTFINVTKLAEWCNISFHEQREGKATWTDQETQTLSRHILKLG